MLKKFAVCAAVMASLYTASALAAPTLRVGSETTFPPFEFVDVKTKQFVGYEIDLINAAGKKAGYNISVQRSAWRMSGAFLTKIGRASCRERV